MKKRDKAQSYTTRATRATRKLVKLLTVLTLIIILMTVITAAGCVTNKNGDGSVDVSKETSEKYNVAYIDDDKISIDGEINEDEWTKAAKISLTKENTSSWQGYDKESHHLPLDVYILWGDKGMYVAADITDNDPDTKNFNDAFEIAVNPNGLIPKEDPLEGLFFSFWMRKETDGKGDVRILRHNIDSIVHAGLEVTDNTLAKYTLTETGWKMEACIPWEFISFASRPVLDLESNKQLINILSEFKPKEGNFLTTTLCYMNGTGTDTPGYSCVYRTSTDMNAEDFSTASYSITLKLAK